MMARRPATKKLSAKPFMEGDDFPLPGAANTTPIKPPIGNLIELTASDLLLAPAVATKAIFLVTDAPAMISVEFKVSDIVLASASGTSAEFN